MKDSNSHPSDKSLRFKTVALRMQHQHPLYVTSPELPDLEEYTDLLREVWDSRHITNCGIMHRRLEEALSQHLGTPHISLYSNGTLPLLTALRHLGLHSATPHGRRGEVITTPYTFIATLHAIEWCGLTPVFADVDPLTGCLDPKEVAKVITPQTVAIMPVHVYGRPCDTAAFDTLSREHGIPVIYDAAHAFGVEVDGRSILLEGDMSTISFHATKVFNTVEGGAAICRSAADKEGMDRLRDFGYVDQTHIESCGINAKLDELRAAYGLLTLRDIKRAIIVRRFIAMTYDNLLADIPGLTTPAHVIPEMQRRMGVSISYTHPYYPVLIDEKEFGISRDELYTALQDHGIFTRRYFHPLASDFAPYSSHPSAAAHLLPNARRMASQVITLPLSGHTTPHEARRVVDAIRQIHHSHLTSIT